MAAPGYHLPLPGRALREIQNYLATLVTLQPYCAHAPFKFFVGGVLFFPPLVSAGSGYVLSKRPCPHSEARYLAPSSASSPGRSLPF